MKVLSWLRRHLPFGSASLGAWGEALAAWYLWWNGYVVIERRWKSRYGEIDLIAVRGQLIVFIEVKTRRRWHVPLADAVSFQQRTRVVRAAMAYLKRHDLLDYRCRFDIIGVTWSARSRPRIAHLEGAFDTEQLQ